MDWNKIKLVATGFGCAALIGLLVVAGLFFLPLASGLWGFFQNTEASTQEVAQADAVTVTPIRITVTPVPVGDPLLPDEQDGSGGVSSDQLETLYQEASPGVVSIFASVDVGPTNQSGAGSGFILDEMGHIVTNNHVVTDANLLVVIFHDGTQAIAQIIGTDDDSDLAVIKVDQLPQNTRPLPLGDADQVNVGDWVVAIGNPFGLNSSMSVGIVSAIGRTIPSGATLFSIPEAIQTDAAINPGNSGGPLMNLRGQVIGVNAQIATGGQQANAGVGFAIPVNIVRRVSPILVEVGKFQWPWLGISGTSVNLFIQRAESLESQAGAYVIEVVDGSPADEAGLRGSTGVEEVEGLSVPVGGDVILEIDGLAVENYSDLLVQIAMKQPGETINLLVLRDGETQEISVKLAPRPESSSR